MCVCVCLKCLTSLFMAPCPLCSSLIRLLSLLLRSVLLVPASVHEYISQSDLHPPFPCGTKLIEDDWFFPGCSDSALETRQQELEEELAQARGLGQHGAKKLAAPSQRSLQVSGPDMHVFTCTCSILWKRMRCVSVRLS